MSGFIGDHMMTSILGNGIAGLQSPGGLLGGGAGLTGGSGMEGGSARSRTRKELRKAFGNNRILKNVIRKYRPIFKVENGYYYYNFAVHPELAKDVLIIN